MHRMRSLSLLVLCTSLLAAGCTPTHVAVPALPASDVARIAGHLRIPAGAGPFPAVVLLHGCGGIRANAHRWARHLGVHGYATLVLDSFGPRRVSEICSDFRRVPLDRRIADAWAGLRFLARRPDIAPERIAVMGFSNGGVVALDAVDAIDAMAISERFSAAVALYPECRGRSPVFGVPVQIIIGDRDDWTLAESCRDIARASRTAGVPIELAIYPGAEHAFDDGTAGAYLPRAVNINSTTGYGASYRGDRRSRERAERDVPLFLARVLREVSTEGNPPAVAR